MLQRYRFAALAVAFLLVLAGCGSGPTSQSPTSGTRSTATPTTTQTPTPSAPPAVTATTTPDASQQYSIPVRNGTLPVDVNRTFARVQSLLGTDARPRPVELRNLSEWRGTLPRLGASPLNRALGFENVSVDWSQPTGVTRPSGYVYVHTGDGSPAEVERVLAHEFVHTVQFRAGMLPWLDRLDQSRLTLDLLKTRLALVEGGAVYTADAYTDQYLAVQNSSAQIRDIYRTRTDSHRIVISHYLYGYRYVARQVDSPANLSRVYENHPTTTEQILHDATPDTEPEASLSVSRNVSHPDWEYIGNNTVGELILRTALRTELDRSRAVSAAAGWGTDELVVVQHVRNDSRFGWAWVHRWDTAADASEATDAFSAYADARDSDSQYTYRVSRIDETTTAFVFGDDSLVTNTTVGEGGDAVTVSVGS